MTKMYTSCPVVGIAYTVLRFVSPRKKIAPDKGEIIRTLDYINYDPEELRRTPCYIKTVEMYSCLCQHIFEYYRHEYAHLDKYLADKGLLFGILCNDDDADTNTRGCCGWEPQHSAYRIYINPELVPTFPVRKQFTYLFDVAKHEMAHLFLHAYDPEAFPLEKSIHSEEFIEIMTEVDNYFYNKNELLENVTKYLVKK